MATRIDPSRTSLLRVGFSRDMRVRFTRLKQKLWVLLVEEDALGLTSPSPPFTLSERACGVRSAMGWPCDAPAGHRKEMHQSHGDGFYASTPTVNADRQVWRFRTSPQKTKAFREWLQKRIDEGVLSTDPQGKPWTSKYVESAYKKGVVRSYIDTHKKRLAREPKDLGGQEEFLRSSFGKPERLSKLELLMTRTFEELKGLTNTMATQLNRILTDGLSQGKNPREIAREIAKQIEGITKGRAERIARTEIIHAHAEGQLDAFEEMGVTHLNVYAEWATAGDEKVCPHCHALEGAVFTVPEARGLIPRHPNCRCAWLPAEADPNRNRSRDMKRKVRDSLKKDKRSKWAGKRLRQPPAKTRNKPRGKTRRR